jgi:hypothetical protein
MSDNNNVNTINNNNYVPSDSQKILYRSDVERIASSQCTEEEPEGCILLDWNETISGRCGSCDTFTAVKHPFWICYDGYELERPFVCRSCFPMLFSYLDQDFVLQKHKLPAWIYCLKGVTYRMNSYAEETYREGGQRKSFTCEDAENRMYNSLRNCTMEEDHAKKND